MPPSLLSPNVAVAGGNIGAMSRSSRLLYVPRLLPRPRRSRQQIGEGDVCGSQLLQSRLSHGLQVSPALEVKEGVNRIELYVHSGVSVLRLWII